MKQLFLINDNLANKISYFHLLLLMASLPFDMFYGYIILGSFAIHTIIQFKRRPLTDVFTWRNLVLISVFLVTAASTIYTAYQPEAMSMLGRHAMLLVFPVLFCLTSLDMERYRPRLLLGFSLLCTITVLYLYLNALYIIRFYHLSLVSLLSGHFTNHNFSDPIGMHATFLSMQLGIALIYLVTVLFRPLSLSNKIFYGLCVALLSAGLLQLGAKSVIFCLFIIINFAVPAFLLPKAKRVKFMMAAALISLLPVIFIMRSHVFRERYVSELKSDLSQTQNEEEAVEPRLERWEAATPLFVSSPMIGHGAGSEIDMLHDEFYNRKLYHAFLDRLNIHSEYLSFLLKSGIAGLLVYIATLVFGFRIAIKKHDLLFFTFMLIIAGVSISENLLDVDKGVIFYTFFFSFFMFSAEVKKEKRNDNLLYDMATNGRFAT